MNNGLLVTCDEDWRWFLIIMTSVWILRQKKGISWLWKKEKKIQAWVRQAQCTKEEIITTSIVDYDEMLSSDERLTNYEYVPKQIVQIVIKSDKKILEIDKY